MGPLAVGLLQALLVAGLLVDPQRLLTAPIRSGDYTPHFYEAAHAGDHLRSTGMLWGFDPFWMAGYPEGLVGIVDNKLFSLYLSVVPQRWQALVFNALVLSILLAVPWMVYAGARAARLEASSRRGAALAAVLGTFSVPPSVFFWSWGGISFFFISVLVVPITVVLATTLSHGSLRSPRGALVTAAAMLAVFTHPVAALLLGLGLVPVLWLGPKPLRRRLVELAVLGLLLAVTLLPIIQALAVLRGPFRPADPGAHEMFRGGLRQLRSDWWIHVLDTTSLHNGAGGLLLILPLAAWGAILLRRGSRESVGIAKQVILVEVIGCALLAYVLPSLLTSSAMLQPYRFLIPLTFFACIPAGIGIDHALRSLAAGRPVAWALAAVAVFVVANAVGGLMPILALGYGRDAAEVELLAFLERATKEEDRILVEVTTPPLFVNDVFGRAIFTHRFALLPLSIRREFLGYNGLSPFAAHRYARFQPGSFFGKGFKDVSPEIFEATLRRFAVSWAVGCTRPTLAFLRGFSAILEEVGPAADCRIFRVRAPDRSRFLEGEGRVRADLDRLEVTEARGDRVVLKYHWIPNLVTEPPLPIAEVRPSGVPVGFIAVRPEATRAFTIRLRRLFEFASLTN